MCFVCLCVCEWRFVRHTLRETVFGGFFSFQKPSLTPTQFGVCVFSSHFRSKPESSSASSTRSRKTEVREFFRVMEALLNTYRTPQSVWRHCLACQLKAGIYLEHNPQATGFVWFMFHNTLYFCYRIWRHYFFYNFFNIRRIHCSILEKVSFDERFCCCLIGICFCCLCFRGHRCSDKIESWILFLDIRKKCF